MSVEQKKVLKSRERQTILLTGGTGFLGSCILKKLIFNRYQVIVLKRSFSNTSRIENLIDKLQVFDIDRINLETIFKDNKIDVIIHTATNYGRNNESISQVVEANFMLPLRLVEMAVRYNVKTFFNTDTILSKYMNTYSLSKRQFLEWLKWYSCDLKIVNVKLEHFYGPNDNSSKFITKVIFDLVRNVESINFTSGVQKRDFIYVDDVADAFTVILENLETIDRKFNNFEVGSGNSLEIRKTVELIKEITGTTITRLNFGAIPMRQNEIMDSRADIRKLEKMGWAPRISLREGFEKTIQFEKSKLMTPILSKPSGVSRQ
jgi:nucleoside-diphosphate-sugar epimerase